MKRTAIIISNKVSRKPIAIALLNSNQLKEEQKQELLKRNQDLWGSLTIEVKEPYYPRNFQELQKLVNELEDKEGQDAKE